MSLLNYTEFINEEDLYESAMDPAEWDKDGGKYRKAMLDFLNDPSKELKIDDKYLKNYSIKSFLVKDIENLEDVKNVVNAGTRITVNSPFIKLGKVFIPLTHLMKTGIFSTIAATATDTDTKEGMVIYFYYNIGLDFWADLEKSRANISNIQGNSLHPNVIRKLDTWISNADYSIKEQVDRVNEWQSSAEALSSFSKAGYRADRNDVLTTIRSKARQLAGLAPDNWCPGDIYIYDPAASREIYSACSKAETIGEINLLFSDVFSPRSSTSDAIGSLVAISLKQQQARLGRAKEFLTNISTGDTTYNLSKDELAKAQSDTAWAKAEIKTYQDKLRKLSSSSDITVGYNSGNPDVLTDKQVPSKLAAIKLAYHLLSLPKDDPRNLDSNLLSILKFGLKQSDPTVNPPYYKIVGQSKGSANVENVQGGDTLSLLIGGLSSRESQMVIQDSDTRMDVNLFYYVAIGDIAYEIELRSGTTGGKQAGLEFQGKSALGNIRDNTAATESKISALYNKRMSAK